MDKTERLLQLTAHPELCSDEELQQLLADDECRSLYEAMRLSADASAMEDAKARLADGLKEKEWECFVMRNEKPEPGKALKPRSLTRTIPFKIAASIVGVLMLGGIAYAAISSLTSSPSSNETELTTAPSHEGREQKNPSADGEETKTGEGAFYTFSNVTLDTIARELAAYYHVEAVISDKKAHNVRLYYKWNQQEMLETVVADLNHFDHVNLTLEADQLIVK